MIAFLTSEEGLGWLKVLSVVFAGAFAVLGFITPFRESDGKITRLGRIAFMGAIVSLVVGTLAQIQDNRQTAASDRQQLEHYQTLLKTSEDNLKDSIAQLRESKSMLNEQTRLLESSTALEAKSSSLLQQMAHSLATSREINGRTAAIQEQSRTVLHNTERLGEPIRDVYVSYQVALPLTDRKLKPFQHFLDSQATEQRDFDISYAMEHNQSIPSPGDASISVDADDDGDLRHYLSKDRTASKFVRALDLDVEIYRQPMPEKVLWFKTSRWSSALVSRDLELASDASIAHLMDPYFKGTANLRPSAFISYSLEKTAVLFVGNAYMGPLPKWESGRVTSIPDLAGSVIVISLYRDMFSSDDTYDLQLKSRLTGLVTLLIDGVYYVLAVDQMNTGVSNGVRWYSFAIPKNVDVRQYLSLAGVAKRYRMHREHRSMGKR